MNAAKPESSPPQQQKPLLGSNGPMPLRAPPGENEEEVLALQLTLIREYDSIVPVVASLADVREEEAREAVHTAICRVLVGVRRRPTGNPVLAWRSYIIECAKNVLKEKARDVARGRITIIHFSELSPDQGLELMELRSPDPGPTETAEERELQARATEEWAKLPPRQRAVIGRCCGDESFGEIAQAMGVTVGTVKKLYAVGITRLRWRFLGILRPKEAGDPGYTLLRLLRGAA